MQSCKILANRLFEPSRIVLLFICSLPMHSVNIAGEVGGRLQKNVVGRIPERRSGRDRKAKHDGQRDGF